MGREVLGFGTGSAEYGTQRVHFWDGRRSFICQELGSSRSYCFETAICCTSCNEKCHPLC